MIKLKNEGRFKTCPFCGGKVSAKQFAATKFVFECGRCEAEIWLKAADEDDAVKQWNNRGDAMKAAKPDEPDTERADAHKLDCVDIDEPDTERIDSAVANAVDIDEPDTEQLNASADRLDAIFAKYGITCVSSKHGDEHNIVSLAAFAAQLRRRSNIKIKADGLVKFFSEAKLIYFMRGRGWLPTDAAVDSGMFAALQSVQVEDIDGNNRMTARAWCDITLKGQKHFE